MGRWEAALNSHELAAAVAASIGDRNRLAHSLLGCGLTQIELGRADLAGPLLQAALLQARETRNKQLEAAIRQVLG